MTRFAVSALVVNLRKNLGDRVLKCPPGFSFKMQENLIFYRMVLMTDYFIGYNNGNEASYRLVKIYK